MPRIAVILPDLLQGIGMTAILERYFSPVEVENFTDIGALCEKGNHFECYCTDSATFAANIDFFLPRRNQSVVLVPGRSDIVSTGSETPCIVGAGDTLEELLEGIGRALAPDRSPAENSSDELSAREVQVLQLVVSGAINKEIADRLHISLNTVLTHRKNITAKLGIKTISGLTLYALMHGYISTEDIAL